ncbi:Exportin-T [Neolecta irregularis DAH-3]|uniref:Exportin-T n=1 Tax=Neolecta irregularis (strain DAH-3) TaxID=1198029 RepID=A0A1U7LGB7_NEOID|nr:Exportin-T [Neolecta irregularis DAH-3]|eukprot:OLL21700.1 Exportin-T [Neolecta irregularis DAH-3]
MDAQIEQAVACALDAAGDADVKAQAIAFCEQLKRSADGLRVCLALFMHRPRRSDAARLFALQVVEAALQADGEMRDGGHTSGHIDDRIHPDGDRLDDRIDSDRIDSEHTSEHTDSDHGNRIHPDDRDLNHALSPIDIARTALYRWLCAEIAAAGPDMVGPPFLRNRLAHTLTLLYVHSHPAAWPSFFSDLLALLRPPAPRPLVTEFVLRVLADIHLEIADVAVHRSPRALSKNHRLKDTIRARDIHTVIPFCLHVAVEYTPTHPRIAAASLDVLAKWAAWTDLALILNSPFVAHISSFLAHKDIQIATSAALTEIVRKKMKPQDKLALIQTLNLNTVFGQLDLVPDLEFGESLGSLINAQGQELVRVLHDSSASALARSLFLEMFPHILRCLASEYDDISETVLFVLTDFLTSLRKDAKSGCAHSDELATLPLLLEISMRKSRYDSESNWGPDADSDEDALFQELRRKLRNFEEIICAIDPALFEQATLSLVLEPLKSFSKHSNWRDLELILHLMFDFGETMPGNPTYVSDQGPTALGKMMTHLIESDILSFPHPAVQLQYLEVVVRYHGFFKLYPNAIPSLLASLVGGQGVHHPETRVRTRAWYLFHRFVKSLRAKIGIVAEDVLYAMQDMLVIKANDISRQAIHVDAGIITLDVGPFDSLLYLFETAGILVSVDAISPSKRAILTQAVVGPLILDMKAADTTSPVAIVQLHHSFMSLGNFAKGFPENKNKDGIESIFEESAEALLSALQVHKQHRIIREAARFTFSRLCGVLDLTILSKTPRLLNALVENAGVEELSDVLPYLGQLVFRFTTEVCDMLNAVIMPLFQRVLEALQVAPEGTDDSIGLVQLQKAYLTFIIMIFSNDVDKIFYSPENISFLETLLQSIIHYASDSADASTKRLAFSVLAKMVSKWSSGSDSQPVQGFDEFVFKYVSRMCFQVATTPSFNLRDGQGILLLNEIASLQKTIFEKNKDVYVQYLGNIYFPSMNLTGSLSLDYIQALVRLDLKDFRKFFKGWIQQLRYT